MRSRAGLCIVIACASLGGCTCGAKSASSAGDGALPVSAAEADASAVVSGDAASGAIFSAPIAAAHVGSGAVIVAGLVVATKTITAMRLEPDGRIAWTREAVKGVAWSPDAELKAYAAAGGAVVAWRGLRDGKNVKLLVPLAGDGRLLESIADAGTQACTTDDGVAWSEGVSGGRSRVHLRTWGKDGAASRDELGATIDDDYTIVCGAHRVFALSEGGDDAPARAYAVPNAPGFPMTLGPEVFGHDEERDLLPYAEGDDLGVVRISAAGGVAIADMPQGKPLAARREKNKIPADDDIVAVDADARSAYVVYTHDESDRCKDDRGGASVHALRVTRREGEGDASLLVAPAECGKDAGPFWTGVARGAFVIAWAERVPRADKKTSAPIAALAYRAMDGKSPLQRLAQPADALVEAGCADERCYAVALVREPGSDGMRPEAARVLVYP